VPEVSLADLAAAKALEDKAGVTQCIRTFLLRERRGINFRTPFPKEERRFFIAKFEPEPGVKVYYKSLPLPACVYPVRRHFLCVKTLWLGSLVPHFYV
jgi:hypothetical protein